MDEKRDWLERHEKFIAFILIGAALFSLAIMVYVKPPNGVKDNGAALAILNTIVGALTLAFGGAANALFKIMSDSDRRQIGQAASDAITSSGQTIGVEVKQPEGSPVPVHDDLTPDKGE